MSKNKTEEYTTIVLPSTRIGVVGGIGVPTPTDVDPQYVEMGLVKLSDGRRVFRWWVNQGHHHPQIKEQARTKARARAMSRQEPPSGGTETA